MILTIFPTHKTFLHLFQAYKTQDRQLFTFIFARYAKLVFCPNDIKSLKSILVPLWLLQCMRASSFSCSVVRGRSIFILLCGGGSQLILTLCRRSKLRSYDSTNKLRWLMNFSRKVQARGDVVRHVGLLQLVTNAF